MAEIRKAVEADADEIISFDHVARDDERRRSFIRDSVRNGDAWIAMSGDRIAGYAVLEYTFYGFGFISMLYIRPDCRRMGFGAALVEHIEGLCWTEKLFTSTNESNGPMQGLMARMGYSPSGIINNLDPGDPEVVYFKSLREDAKDCSGDVAQPPAAV
jgi:ribosomal protein S18 acetylase RimI-like enzyme